MVMKIKGHRYGAVFFHIDINRFFVIHCHLSKHTRLLMISSWFQPMIDVNFYGLLVGNKLNHLRFQCSIKALAFRELTVDSIDSIALPQNVLPRRCDWNWTPVRINFIVQCVRLPRSWKCHGNPISDHVNQAIWIITQLDLSYTETVELLLQESSFIEAGRPSKMRGP